MAYPTRCSRWPWRSYFSPHPEPVASRRRFTTSGLIALSGAEMGAVGQALVAAAMGHPGRDAGDVLDDFIRGLGMPRSLREVKVGPEHFDRIAQQAMATPWVPRNPRKIEGPAQVREILDMAA